MKISTSDWAKVLYEIVKDKSQEEFEGLLLNFVKILIVKKQIGKIERILEKFSQTWNQENKMMDCQVVSVQKLDDEMIGKIRNFVAKKYQVETVNVENQIDGKIVGGLKIQIEYDLWDVNISGKLDEFKKEFA